MLRSLSCRSVSWLHFSTLRCPRKNSCIVMLKSCDSMNCLQQIHAWMIRLGLQDDRDALTRLISFCVDPSRGNLQYADKVFGYAQSPCLVIYNLMIKAFAKKKSFRKVLNLFCKLREDGLDPDNFTYPFVFKAIGGLRASHEGLKVHGHVVKTGLEFDPYVCNSIMGMYADLGKTDVLKKLFDETIEKDVVSWNTLISGYVRCGMFEDAIGAYKQMREESHLKPDEATVVSTLSACTTLKNLEVGEEVHRYISTQLELTSIMGNALVDMYCKCGCLDVARIIFDGMKSKNVNCWTSMVSGYVNSGQLHKARKLFDRSPVRDIVLWTAMINGYVQFNMFDSAVELFREMQSHKINPDKFIVVALLTGCAQMGALEQGKWIHEYIVEKNITTDTVVGTALVEMYAKCGCVEKALEVFYGLSEKDTASWTSIICGLAMNGQTSKAIKLFSQMKRAGNIPDDITFIGVLAACSHGGLVKEGRQVFESMISVYGIQPKIEHYGCLIDLLGRAGLLDEAEELIQKIPDQNNEVKAPLYGSLLSACRIYGNIRMGERLAKQLEKIAIKGSSTHTLLASIYAFADRWKDVTSVRRKMKDLGVRKVPGCSSIEINGAVHEFIVGDPSHLRIDAIYLTLNQISKSMLGLEQTQVETESLVEI